MTNQHLKHAAHAGLRGQPRRLHRINRLRWAGWIEGSTLLMLLFVAVPLKHLAGIPQATSVVGPVHGLAFIGYVVILVESVSAGGWRTRDAVLAALACLMPFGTFLNDRTLRRRVEALPS